MDQSTCTCETITSTWSFQMLYSQIIIKFFWLFFTNIMMSTNLTNYSIYINVCLEISQECKNNYWWIHGQFITKVYSLNKIQPSNSNTLNFELLHHEKVWSKSQHLLFDNDINIRRIYCSMPLEGVRLLSPIVLSKCVYIALQKCLESLNSRTCYFLSSLIELYDIPWDRIFNEKHIWTTYNSILDNICGW